MTVDDLIEAYRAESDDRAEPPLVSDDRLLMFANEAQTEACRRGQLLLDSSSALCTIAYAAGASFVTLDPLIVFPTRAQTDGKSACLIHVDEMDRIFPSWQDDSVQDRPTHLISGLTTGALHLWPKPKVDGAVKLTVQRMPVPLVNCGDTPEIRIELHPGLVQWMLHRSYSTLDSELYSAAQSADALARFEAEFGRKASGRNEQWMRAGSHATPDPIA